MESIEPDVGPVEGGTEVTISGAFFGTRSGEVAFVSIGGINCTSFDVVSRGIINAVTPPGVGTSLEVIIGLRTGIRSIPKLLWQYEAPLVEAIEPTYLFLGESGMQVSIQGKNFGLVDEDISKIVLAAASPGGGIFEVPCALQQTIRSGNVATATCVLGHLHPANVSAGSFRMLVQVGNQISLSVGGVGLNVVGRPEVRFINPRQSNNAGGIEAEISGRNFGDVSSDVTSVSIGGQVTTFRYNPAVSGSVVAMIPAGSGRNVEVTVSTRGGLSNARAPIFSYLTPQVLTVTPDYSFRGGQLLSFNITGENFGNR